MFCRWRGEPPFGDSTEFEQLVEIVDRLIVDSTEWPDLPGAYGRLAELFERTAVVSDIAWARTERWRSLLASLWPGIADVQRDPRPRHARAGASARGLAALAARPRRRGGGRRARAARGHRPRRRARRRSRPGSRRIASDVLSAQLDRFARDPIYEAGRPRRRGVAADGRASEPAQTRLRAGSEHCLSFVRQLCADFETDTGVAGATFASLVDEQRVPHRDRRRRVPRQHEGDRRHQGIPATVVDRQKFMDLVGEEIERSCWTCLGYSVVETHYHLVIRIEKLTLSSGFQRLNSRLRAVVQPQPRSPRRVLAAAVPRHARRVGFASARVAALPRATTRRARSSPATPEDWPYCQLRLR